MSVVFVLLCLCLPLLPLQAKKERKIVLLRRVHTYAPTLDTVNIGSPDELLLFACRRQRRQAQRPAHDRAVGIRHCPQ